MNWLGFGTGITMIIFVGWVILAARKEGKRMKWDKAEKKLF